ncbi:MULTISPECIES: hypothetical protein [Flavobacterium]|jgi:hypothetical protein|uniref:Oxidase n=1 Tax=Flavobacterium cupriresistens TaxID=2893885 RepID=A0ABU4RH50_9FLAO|nr:MULTISPECIES: hypothetical protein [unclassified Flavobacterium]KLT68368.1 hypothetical protein AB674_18210 [Flavobacterium sp. ABG]MDX6191283.1 hypothetical protein [Flavobacterium sp. Fl-318]UFH42399.1 hypothetical protein LNP23_21650 [Flavobacterium sp. F-323]
MKDFIIEEDLLIAGEDFVLEVADQQNLQHLLLSQKGGYKEFPILGVGIKKYINSPDATSRLRLENEIDKQLTYDNFHVTTLDVNDLQNIRIDGNY